MEGGQDRLGGQRERSILWLGRREEKKGRQGMRERKGQRPLSFFIHYCSGSHSGSWLCVCVRVCVHEGREIKEQEKQGKGAEEEKIRKGGRGEVKQRGGAWKGVDSGKRRLYLTVS